MGKASVPEPLGIAQAPLAHSRKGYEEQMLPELTLTLNGTLEWSDDEVVESLKIKYPDFMLTSNCGFLPCIRGKR